MRTPRSCWRSARCSASRSRWTRWRCWAGSTWRTAPLGRPGIRAGLLVAQGDRFRFANDIVRRVAYDAEPAAVRVSRHRRAARLLEARPEAAAAQLAAAGDRDAPPGPGWRPRTRPSSASPTWRPTSCWTRPCAPRCRPRCAPRRCCAAARCAPSSAGHEDARATTRRPASWPASSGDAELEARVLEQLGWTALYARDALHAVELAERATELAESAAAAPGAPRSALAAAGRVRHWDGDYAGATRPTSGCWPRRRCRTTRRWPSRWPTGARCCSTRTGSPRPRRCWRGRCRCAGAPASSGRCCRPCSSPRWPAATPATSAARCRRWTPRAG